MHVSLIRSMDCGPSKGLVLALTKHYLPGPHFTVDEQLIPFRGRCLFRQYMSAKPDKYGMKLSWICDCKNSYPLKGIPHLGKSTKVKNARQMFLLKLCNS